MNDFTNDYLQEIKRFTNENTGSMNVQVKNSTTKEVIIDENSKLNLSEGDEVTMVFNPHLNCFELIE
jgi:hypothetical protein